MVVPGVPKLRTLVSDWSSYGLAVFSKELIYNLFQFFGRNQGEFTITITAGIPIRLTVEISTVRHTIIGVAKDLKDDVVAGLPLLDASQPVNKAAGNIYQALLNTSAA